ncbi:MAG: hypothetical protein HOA16_13650 [Opitutae bacterium]|jgi:hypothetical protein|nr:hypothetical protein [Opitutae bacterium]MBT7741491.1 hypothetical protein [Opitutae bacterium]
MSQTELNPDHGLCEKAEGLSRGVYLWCIWITVMFSLCSWLLVKGENEQSGVQETQVESSP